MRKDILDVLTKIDTIRRNIDEVDDFIRTQDKKIDKLIQREKHIADYNCYAIIKDIIAGICNGIDEKNAIDEVCDKYVGILRPQCIEDIWKHARKERFCLTMYARVYMAHKMRENGFKICEIQNTMNLSRISVGKLLKTSLFEANNNSLFWSWREEKD